MPWATDVQVQIFTDLLPAAGDSLPEDNQASTGRIAAGVPWSKGSAEVLRDRK